MIEQFDRWGHSPADPAAWFQEMLLHDTHDRNVSKFGQQIRQAPKSGRAKRQPLPKGRRHRSRTRKQRRPAA